MHFSFVITIFYQALKFFVANVAFQIAFWNDWEITLLLSNTAHSIHTQMIFDVLLEFRSRRNTFLAYLAGVIHSQRMSLLVILQGMMCWKNFVTLEACIRFRFMERFVFLQSFSSHKAVHTFTTLISCLTGNSMILQSLTSNEYLRTHLAFKHNTLFVNNGMFFELP